MGPKRKAGTGLLKLGPVDKGAGFNLDDLLGSLLGKLFQPDTDWCWLNLVLLGPNPAGGSLQPLKLRDNEGKFEVFL